MRYAVLLLLALCSPALAGTTIDFHANQTSLTDWQQGGDDAVTWTGQIKGDREVATENHRWTTDYLVQFGQTYLDGWEKSKDRLRGDTQLTWLLALPVDPFIALSAQTQVDPFWDPAQLSQSAGVAIDIGPLRTRAGVAAREVVTDKTSIDGGWESVTTLKTTFTEELALSARVEVFTPLREMAPRLESDATLRWQAAKYVTAQVGLEVRRDPGGDVGIRQTAVVGVGIIL